MRIFTKAAASTAAVGLLAFGTVVGIGGSALAGPAPSPDAVVTGCTSTLVTVAVGLQPNCVAIAGTTHNPTAIYIYVDTTSLVVPKVADAATQAMDATWTLSCVVNGTVVNTPGTFDVTPISTTAIDAIDLQQAVGSPEPDQCTVEDLTVKTALPLNVGAPAPFQVGVAAQATNAVPGAVYQEEGTTSGGAHAVVCADDTANGNAGSKIQSFQCLSDLAEVFVHTSTGQLVHNGDCVGMSGSNVILAKCTAGKTTQEWVQSTAGGTVRNRSAGTCLTAVSVKDGMQLAVKPCGSWADQKWDLPAMSAVPAPPILSAAPDWSAVR